MLKGALIGFGVTLAMFIPPVIHWVSGPLGPLVGGVFGGSSARVRPSQAPLIGALMGLFLIAPLSLLIVASSFADWLIPQSLRGILGVLALIIVLYTSIMGSIGAAIGGALALSQTRSEN